ncbi:MAG: class I SAM-dependent RNA methyltransferase [Oligoflexia bacterium]|nr:class I SAM-dependent RNA methyltransferase [Oligoflexia bacterium]
MSNLSNPNEDPQVGVQTFNATVRNLSSKGYGVVEHPDGRIFFAKGCWPGDVSSFQIESFKKRYGEAILLQIIEPSDERVAPACPYQGHRRGECGGCPWMIATYSAQIKYKLHRIEYAFSRQKILLTPNSSISGRIIKDFWEAPEILGYRNRLQLKTDGTVVGLVSAQSKVLVPVTDCLVLNTHCRTILKDIVAILPRDEWRPHKNSNYLWNYLEIDDDIRPQSQDDLISSLEINKRRSFRQGNSQQNQRMQEWLKEKLLTSSTAGSMYPGPILELFSGDGNFTKIIAEANNHSALHRHIWAVDLQGEALQTLRKKELPLVNIVELDLFQSNAWFKLKPMIDGPPSMVILNPPREGLEYRKNFFTSFPELKEIFYISCNPDTFVRDANDIICEGYQLCEVQPLDQFPHTSHMELLAHFRRE